jgi:DMSO/TMAO reductase YedYZ molybdopterin-dependent catalytic subunit
LQGLTGPVVTVGADDLEAMPHRTVTATVHGLGGAYGGVPLGLLLAKVGAPQGEALHGAAMADLVIAKACDGYRVVLSLPEIDPAFRDGAVILADSLNGRPLDSHEGPFRLVVEGDKRAARSARCVTGLTVTAVP